ncbi:MAG: ABC transporter substrate-binding protein [Streptosporangiaceae bacterium]
MSAFALGTNACAGSSAGSAGSAGSLTSVTFRTDYLFNGYLAPVAVAVQNGYFRQEGLNVAIGIGQGSATTIDTVASGRDQFGFATTDLVGAAITDHNVPIKVIAEYLQNNPNGIVYKKSETTGTVADIVKKGLTQISCAGCEGTALWVGVLKREGYSTSNLKVENVSSTGMASAFLAAKNTFMTAFGPGEAEEVQAKDPGVGFHSLADYGLVMMDDGLITSDAMIQEHPQTVAAFVKGLTLGWEYAIKHPEEAAKDATKYSKQPYSEVLAELQETIHQFLHTKASQGLPVGATAVSDWQATLTLLKQIGVVTGSLKPVSDYYDGSFIPSSTGS